MRLVQTLPLFHERVSKCANKCMIDVGQVIGKPFETVFSVLDRQSGALSEIQEPQTDITHEFFTGLDDFEGAEDQGGAAQ